jgi:hypothetical protein
MDLLVHRDLIQDDLGNYYIISSINGHKLTLVHAVVYFSFNQIANEEFINTVKNQYGSPVGVGQFFTDIVKNKINGFQEGKYPGGIYSLKEVLGHYDIELDNLYEVNVNV